MIIIRYYRIKELYGRFIVSIQSVVGGGGRFFCVQAASCADRAHLEAPWPGESCFSGWYATCRQDNLAAFAEYLEFKKIHIAKKDLQLLDVYFLDYMREGGLPENIVYPTRDYLMNLADDIIQKDIAAYYGVRDHQLLRDYFTLLMERSGKQVSINKISHILKISLDTSRRYLSYFENAFLIYLVPRWGKTNEQLLAPKKVYACDLGFKYLFIGERDKGSYFENYVYLQLRSKGPVYYYYQDGIELDFLINGDILVECKYNEELKGLQLQAFNDYPAGMKYFVGSVRDLEVLDERVTG